ncbi:hypothetical protein [Flavobacterium sp.]|uniref:hypothetical protein n=1 Tax=Flavobacterium sp. TaxID=239 RepID=UPI00262CFEF0|nr:hypothetical protein [Flavobacterium sp.]
MKIETTQDFLPTNFKDAVHLLKRPYISITVDQVKEIERKTKDAGDIIIYRGQRMTWGNADGGYALMPLNSQ